MARGWSELRQGFPKSAQLAQSHIIEAVRNGDFVAPELCPIELRHPTRDITASYGVMCDAFKIGKPGDSVRVNVTHATAQAIADLLGLRVLTSKLVDDRNAQADVFSEPILRAITTTVAGMEEHSRALDAKLAGGRLKGGIGKQWINHPRLANPSAELFGKDTAINYDWASKRGTGSGGKRPWPSASRPRELSVWQQPGGQHNAGIADVNSGHTDRSQFLVMGSDSLTVHEGGISMFAPIDAVALDPLAAQLVSVDGPVMMRHPWISPCLSLAEGGTCPNVPPPIDPDRQPTSPKGDGGGVAVASALLAGAALAWYLWAYG